MLASLFRGRTPYLLGFAASFGLVGLALYLQLRNHLEPCPLCIMQRIAFMALGVTFLMAALHNPAGLWRKFYGALQLAAAATGAGIAGRHVWIQANPEQVMAECGVGFDYMVEQFPMSKAIQLIFQGSGDCAVIDWTFLGMTIPQLSLLAFTGFGLYAVALAWRRAP